MWEKLRGHQRQVEMFRRAIQRERTAHAYLFVGPHGIGKKLFAKKETTTTAPKTTTSVSVVDNATDAGKWIDAWKKNSTTGGGGDSSSAASEASKWIEGWSQWSKDQVGGDATAPTEATADGRDSAEKWIAQWKADGSPTDESRKGDAKKWIDDWKNKTN